MEKTIVIDGKEVKFRSTGATPIRFKAQFRKDYFAEVMKLNLLEKLDKKQKQGEDLTLKDYESIDFDIFYNIAWVLAKTADKDIPDPISWLDSFDEFPMLEIIPELQDMVISTLQSKKK
jgi:hypothetical protein